MIRHVGLRRGHRSRSKNSTCKIDIVIAKPASSRCRSSVGLLTEQNLTQGQSLALLLSVRRSHDPKHIADHWTPEPHLPDRTRLSFKARRQPKTTNTETREDGRNEPARYDAQDRSKRTAHLSESDRQAHLAMLAKKTARPIGVVNLLPQGNFPALGSKRTRNGALPFGCPNLEDGRC